MKTRVARTIKWNMIDRVLTQLLYAVTGIVLANVLSKADFGLVGAILVFQAFASLFVDSGFSSALIQKKNPDDTDYSTVFWFNLGAATALYLILYACAPFIADCYKGDQRIIPLSRVMFLTFILNATAIVQTNRLMKRMEVKMIAVSNSVGLVASAVTGIYLALAGWGAWAIVWQSIVLAAVKSAILWATSSWRPLLCFSVSSLKSIFSIGSGAMISSFLNTIFQNIYGFFIGNRVGMVSMGYYHQADKWSKMGIMSLSQVLTSSFLPVLSQYQDSPSEFAAATSKMNRFTGYVLFPAVGVLIAISHPLFHALFGTKWDASIPLFQLLLVRGIFTVLQLLYNNYILALGRSRLLVYTEILRDGAALGAIFVTLPYIAVTSPGDPTEGLRIFLWGQVISSALTWALTLVFTARLSQRHIGAYLYDLFPYLAETIVIMIPLLWVKSVIGNPWLLMSVQLAAGMAAYIGINALLRSRVQSDALNYILKRG